MSEIPIDFIEPTGAGAKRWFALSLVIILMVGGLGLFLWWWPGPTTEQRFVVPRGASAHTVARDLHDAHLIGVSWAFRIWAKLGGSRNAIHPGVYRLKPGWTGYRV